MAILNRQSVRTVFPRLSLLCGLVSGLAAGHELSLDLVMAPPAVVVRASYGSSEPLSFAALQLLSPGAPAQASTQGRTDARGYFSFVPDRAGDWKVVVDDEMGHRAERVIQVPPNFEQSSAASTGAASRLERAITGIAVMLGLTGALYGWRARRAAQPGA